MECVFNNCTNRAVLAFDGNEENDTMCGSCSEYRRLSQGISENGWTLEDCPISVARELFYHPINQAQ